MSRHWKEQYDPNKHRNHMRGEGCKIPPLRNQQLDPRWVFFVRECGFTFEFHSLGQLRVCLDYFRVALRPPTRISGELWKYGGDHWERQRWFERLPAELYRKSKRKRIVKALERAQTEFEREAG